MAKQSKSVAVETVAAELPAVTLESRIASHVSLVIGAAAEAESIAKAATEAVGKAHRHVLTEQVALWSGSAGINDVAFDATVKDPMFKAYQLSKAYKNDSAIRNRMAFDKVTVIALTNGILPLAGETQQVFAKRVGPLLKSTQGMDGKPLYTPKTGSNGGRKAKDGTSDAVAAKGVEMTRTTALNILCKGNEADMQVLDFMTQPANMLHVRAMYVALNPIKVK